MGEDEEVQCDECNGWFPEDELDDGVCEACIQYMHEDYKQDVRHAYYHDRI